MAGDPALWAPLLRAPFFERAGARALRAGERGVRLTGLVEGARALVLGLLAARTGRPLLLVAARRHRPRGPAPRPVRPGRPRRAAIRERIVGAAGARRRPLRRHRPAPRGRARARGRPGPPAAAAASTSCCRRRAPCCTCCPSPEEWRAWTRVDPPRRPPAAGPLRAAGHGAGLPPGGHRQRARARSRGAAASSTSSRRRPTSRCASSCSATRSTRCARSTPTTSARPACSTRSWSGRPLESPPTEAALRRAGALPRGRPGARAGRPARGAAVPRAAGAAAQPGLLARLRVAGGDDRRSGLRCCSITPATCSLVVDEPRACERGAAAARTTTCAGVLRAERQPDPAAACRSSSPTRRPIRDEAARGRTCCCRNWPVDGPDGPRGPSDGLLPPGAELRRPDPGPGRGSATGPARSGPRTVCAMRARGSAERLREILGEYDLPATTLARDPGRRRRSVGPRRGCSWPWPGCAPASSSPTSAWPC